MYSPKRHRDEVEDAPDDVQGPRGDVGALGEHAQLDPAHDEADQARQPRGPQPPPPREDLHRVDDDDGDCGAPRLCGVLFCFVLADF